MGYKTVSGLTGMYDLKRTEYKPGSRMRQVLSLSSKDKWVSKIVRQELGEFFWTFPQPEDNVFRNPQNVAPCISNNQQRWGKGMGSDDSTDINYGFLRAAFQLHYL